MPKRNFFEGKTYYAEFSRRIYEHIVSHSWFSYTDIMREVTKEDNIQKISGSPVYGELKKAFSDVLNSVKQKAGNECIEIRGNNRNKSFRYTGNDKDPLVEMRQAKVIHDIRRYWEFCQDSAGFFPVSWLEYFLKDSRDLFEIKNRKQTGEQLICSSSLERRLTNIDLLPYFYDAIKQRKVLLVRYVGNKPPYDVPETLAFHPQYLREYNGRWQLYGHVDGKTPTHGYKIALDRIIGKPEESGNKETSYVPAPPYFYEDYFRYIIGVTHLESSTPVEVRVRAHTLYMYTLVKTKCLHHTQTVVLPFGIHEEGRQYGDFSIRVEINNEFIGSILQMGPELEIISPSEVRETSRLRIGEMADRYR